MAVTLPDGKVLVTGGFNNPNSFKTSELWDPGTGKWSATGPMHTDRVGATLTLLQNGKVLAAGGSTTTGVTGACELYDPATGKWSRTGALNAARYQHTATLLLDGRVLAAGGIGQGGQYLATAEIYDPTTGRWHNISVMNAPRESHAASLLANGDVLVTGGDSQLLTGTLGSTEFYHIATNQWSLVGHMTSSRFFHVQATLADGSVIVAGGAFGDGFAYDPFPSTDRFDPATGTWSAIGDMQVVPNAAPKEAGRTFFTSTPLGNGMILAAGGIGTGTNPNRSKVLSTAELFDPSTGTWSLTADMQRARAQHAAVELSDGRAMVISGTIPFGGVTPTVEIFTPSSMSLRQPRRNAGEPTMLRRYAPPTRAQTRPGQSFVGRGRWTQTGSMNFAREGEPAVLLQDGRVLVEGCTSPFTTGGKSAELFDPATGKWALTGSMHVSRCRHSAQLLPDGRVLVVGGDGGPKDADLPTAETFDPSTGTWAMAGFMNSARTLSAMLPLPGGKFLVAAGAAQGTIPRDSADIYDSSTGAFTSTPSMNISRYAFASTTLADGRVLVEGGTTQDSLNTSTCEIYDPVANVWTLTGAIRNPAEEIVLLLDGDVLATNQLNGSSSSLFTPAAGQWRATRGSMNFVRNASTSTLLDDGRVLVAGGEGPNTLVLISEFYNPVTQKWVIGPSLHSGRWAHSAVRLADGRVLVVGGLNARFEPIATAEIYSP